MPTTVHVNDQQGMVFFLEPNMKVGVPELDDDNNRLFKIINKVNLELYEAPYCIDKMKSLFKELLDFGKSHFELEEHLFEKIDYEKHFKSEAVHHREEHLQFISQVEQFSSNVEDYKMIEVLKFLCEWLNQHVLNTDKQFAQIYKEVELA